MRKKRIAIIGAGGHAKGQHYPSLAYADEIELCAACDLAPEKLEEVRKPYDIPAVYTDYREMIDKERPEGIVVVMTPMDLTGVVLGCLEMGQHVMIEKPPGCNSGEAQQMLDLAQQNDCKIMVSMNRRFMPLVRKIKEMAQERGLVYCSATYNKAGFFTGKWNWPASLPVADAIHLIDLTRFVCGEVTEVHAATAKRDAEYTNSCCGTVVFESGAWASINNHQCVGARVHRFEVHTLNLSAYMDVGATAAPSCELWLDNEKAVTPDCAVEVPDGVGSDNYFETLHFARWVAGEEEGEAALSDVIKSVKLAEALESGYRGRMEDFG